MKGAEFRELRQRVQLRITAAALVLGVTRATIYRWEADTSAIPSEAADALRRLARNDHGALIKETGV